jgi:hypothetical protein
MNQNRNAIRFFLFWSNPFGLGYELMLPYDDRWGRVDLFLHSDRAIYPSSYFYYSGETILYILLAVLIMRLMAKIPAISEFKHFALVFIVLEFGDLLDFWITDNDLWFEFRGWPITYNVIKVLVFILVLIYEYAWDYFTSDPTGDVPRA